MITTYYVRTWGNDANTGAINSPFLTLNYALSLCTNGQNVDIGSGTFAENIDISTLLSSSFKTSIYAKSDTIVNVAGFFSGASQTKLIFRNGTYSLLNYTVNDRRVLFDNATVNINGNNAGYTLFYHSNVNINFACAKNIFISSVVNVADAQYWYDRNEWLFYKCRPFLPASAYRLNDIKVPMVDKLGLTNFMHDVWKEPQNQ